MPPSVKSLLRATYFRYAVGFLRSLVEKYWVFYSESLSKFGTVGAIAPSSVLLAKAMVKPLYHRSDHPISVLEVGPGTGVFTAEILKHLGFGDCFDIYELNSKFYDYLIHILDQQDLTEKGIYYHLHKSDIRSLKEPREYDFIISGLPFNSFDAQTVDEILRVLMSHLAPMGVFAYFEYSLPPKIRSYFLTSLERVRIQRTSVIMNQFIRKHQFHCDQVWWNLPPAKVRYCRRNLWA